jgi:hypothetical protein
MMGLLTKIVSCIESLLCVHPSLVLGRVKHLAIHKFIRLLVRGFNGFTYYGGLSFFPRCKIGIAFGFICQCR